MKKLLVIALIAGCAAQEVCGMQNIKSATKVFKIYHNSAMSYRHSHMGQGPTFLLMGACVLGIMVKIHNHKKKKKLKLAEKNNK